MKYNKRIDKEFEEKLTELVGKYILHSNVPEYLLGKKVNVDINKIHQKITIYYGRIPKIEKKLTKEM
ncbi:MAG: hypothetical protein NUV47_02440 [Patescibacteria group bacterium]|nr:hypothetical protein [Patescibacteria group bacterium]